MTPEAMAAGLEAVLARELTGFAPPVTCQRLTGGANQETWRVEFDQHGARSCLALRRKVATRNTDEGGIGIGEEADLLRLAAAGGVPVPKVVHQLAPGDELGEGVLLQWLQGQTRGDRINRDPGFKEVRPGLARQCGTILAAIHRLPITDVPLQRHLPQQSTEALVRLTWQAYRDLDVAQPMIDFTARWLLDHLPAGAGRTLVHGDFRNGNLMVCPQQGIVGVLDWELASIGDPLRDLGWLCVNSWRFGNRALPVGGFGTIEDLLAGYRQAGGGDVEPQHLQYWMVFGSFWWAVTCLRMARDYREQPELGLERPAIGRRSSEAQMDCVELLVPGKLPGPPTADQDPTRLAGADAILESVATFLNTNLREQVDGQSRYLARVAANALASVERQLTLGPSLDSMELERLQVVLGKHGELDTLRWQLVEQLRDRSLALDAQGLGDHLRSTVYGQLQIDQPGYLEPRQSEG